jgi:carboxypeptidase C (cathepsin A)
VTRPLRGDERKAFTYVAGERKDYKVGYTINEYTPWMKHIVGDSGDNSLSNYVSHYLNMESVRTAMHIPTSVGGWEECNDTISNTYKVGTKGSFEIYKLLKNKIKIMFFCGDTDGAVPCWGAHQWIKNLNWDIKEQTVPYYSDGNMAGLYTRYDGMDFATVHGAGHMSPQWKRKAVTNLITSWIHDEKVTQ